MSSGPQPKRCRIELTLGKLLNKRKNIDWDAIGSRILSHPAELSESVFRRAIRKPKIPIDIVRKFLAQSQRSFHPNQGILKMSTLWFAWFKVKGVRFDILRELIHSKLWGQSPSNVAGLLLIRALDRTNKHRPCYSQVKLLIDMYPLCLSYKDGLGHIPLHVAMRYEKKNNHVVELLIEKGLECNLDGIDGRGGLFIQDNEGNASACDLTHHIKHWTMYSERLLQLVLGGEFPLIREEDIIRHNLFHGAIENNDVRLVYMMILQYPNLLVTLDKFGDLPIHTSATSCSIHCTNGGSTMFRILLCEGLRHGIGGKDALGGLLVQNVHNPKQGTALDSMVENALKYGWDGRAFVIFNHFESIVPAFLFEAAKRSSRAFKSLLLLCNPMCIGSKDGSRRLLLHHAVMYGLEWDSGCKIVLKENILAVKEPDGPTGLLPFMLAGAGASTDLSTIYSLLREYPEAIY